MPDQPKRGPGRPPKPPSERAPRKPSSGPSGAHRRATPEHLAEVDALIARARVALAPHAHAYRDLDAALGLRLGTISRLRHELRDLSRLRAAVERLTAPSPATAAAPAASPGAPTEAGPAPPRSGGAPPR